MSCCFTVVLALQCAVQLGFCKMGVSNKIKSHVNFNQERWDWLEDVEHIFEKIRYSNIERQRKKNVGKDNVVKMTIVL